jgi:YcxB-like protein
MMWALWPIKVLAGLTLLALIGGLVLSLAGADLPGLTLLALALVWGLALSLMFVLRPGRQYQRLERLAAEQSFCFAENEVSWAFLDGSSRCKWTYFDDVLETPSLYVLRHQRKRLGQLVPKRAFKNSNDEARFRELAKHHLKFLS